MEFNQLVKEHGTYIKKIINTKKIYNIEDQEDIYQESLIKIWKGIDNFKGESKITTWIYNVVNSAICNFFNKEKQQNDMIEQPLIELDDPYHILERKEAFNNVNNFNPNRKRIFQLILDGKSNNDIADELDIPIGTIYSNIARIKKELIKP
jgi:RNA polymerase sigma-70 factor, ECF subfamily